VLDGQRVIPRKLTEAGYAFRYPELEPALRHVLNLQGATERVR
jgi:NAD dependent epimerase/dehydratase family enzyme